MLISDEVYWPNLTALLNASYHLRWLCLAAIQQLVVASPNAVASVLWRETSHFLEAAGCDCSLASAKT